MKEKYDIFILTNRNSRRSMKLLCVLNGRSLRLGSLSLQFNIQVKNELVYLLGFCTKEDAGYEFISNDTLESTYQVYKSDDYTLSIVVLEVLTVMHPTNLLFNWFHLIFFFNFIMIYWSPEMEK